MTVPVSRLDYEERAVPRTRALEPHEACQQRWARGVLEDALRRCCRHYRECGRDRTWEAFYVDTVRPILSGARQTSQTQVAAEVGLPDADEVAQAVFEVRRRMRRILLETVSETVTDPSAARDEMRTLLDTLRVG